MGASGDDRYGVAFSSGWMIQEINRFSVLSLYDNSKEDVSYHSFALKPVIQVCWVEIHALQWL